jgi:hypothetical protein
MARDERTTLARALKWSSRTHPTTMEPTVNPYAQLKRRAKRLLLAGDVERYLRTLGRLHALRAMSRPGLA